MASVSAKPPASTGGDDADTDRLSRAGEASQVGAHQAASRFHAAHHQPDGLLGRLRAVEDPDQAAAGTSPRCGRTSAKISESSDEIEKDSRSRGRRRRESGRARIRSRRRRAPASAAPRSAPRDPSPFRARSRPSACCRPRAGRSAAPASRRARRNRRILSSAKASRARMRTSPAAPISRFRR